jgi:hypothetical protein
MQDMLTQLEKLRRDAAECELIRDLATDPSGSYSTDWRRICLC